MRSIASASELVSGIKESSREQANAIAQMNTGLSQVDAVTQQNAASAEAMASAAEQLEAEAAAVRNAVGGPSGAARATSGASRAASRRDASAPRDAATARASQPTIPEPAAPSAGSAWGELEAPARPGPERDASRDAIVIRLDDDDFDRY